MLATHPKLPWVWPVNLHLHLSVVFNRLVTHVGMLLISDAVVFWGQSWAEPGSPACLSNHCVSLANYGQAGPNQQFCYVTACS